MVPVSGLKDYFSPDRDQYFQANPRTINDIMDFSIYYFCMIGD